jgi:hypothetical protein
MAEIEAELREALRMLTPTGIREFAAHREGAGTLGKIVARLDAEAVRSERAAEGCSARAWHREATQERERADDLRRRANALRVVVQHRDEAKTAGVVPVR